MASYRRIRCWSRSAASVYGPSLAEFFLALWGAHHFNGCPRGCLIGLINRCAHAVGVSCGEFIDIARVLSQLRFPLGYGSSKPGFRHPGCPCESGRRMALEKLDESKAVGTFVKTQGCTSGRYLTSGNILWRRSPAVTRP